MGNLSVRARILSKQCYVLTPPTSHQNPSGDPCFRTSSSTCLRHLMHPPAKHSTLWVIVRLQSEYDTEFTTETTTADSDDFIAERVCIQQEPLTRFNTPKRRWHTPSRRAPRFCLRQACSRSDQFGSDKLSPIKKGPFAV